jgi:hypothetical protein
MITRVAVELLDGQREEGKAERQAIVLSMKLRV